MTLFKKIIPHILVILLSIFSILPLFQPGFFPMHDNTQVQRVYEMAKSLSVGMFPVRWVSDLGYGLGYPIFNFYAPLAYYFGAKFVILGFDALIATKIMIVFGMLLSGVLMYLLAKEFFGKNGAVISALLYVYFPYHAVNLYVRGAISELFAYAFIPLCFFGAYKLFKENKYLYVLILAIGFSGVILSHNLTAMMITPFLITLIIIFAILNYKKKNNLNTLHLIFAFSLGLLVSAFYWLPALLEMEGTNVISTIGKTADFRNHFICINQLWYSQWGFGGSTASCNDGLSFMLGKLNIIFVLLSIVGLIAVLLLKKKIEKKSIVILLISTIGLFLSIFLTLPYSRFIWEALPPMEYFQYPWRFLNMVGFFTAVLGGAVVPLTSKFIKNKKIVFAEFLILIVLILTINSKFFQPQKILNVKVSDYTSEYSLKWTTSKISDEYLPKGVKKPNSASEALKNKQAFSFKETPIERNANLLSLAGIVVAVLGIIYTRKRK